jgi:hypothetical protein
MKPYRTAATLLLFGLMVVGIVYLCPEASRAGTAAAAFIALSALGAAAAGKSAFEKHVEARPEQPK